MGISKDKKKIKVFKFYSIKFSKMTLYVNDALSNGTQTFLFDINASFDGV